MEMVEQKLPYKLTPSEFWYLPKQRVDTAAAPETLVYIAGVCKCIGPRCTCQMNLHPLLDCEAKKSCGLWVRHDYVGRRNYETRPDDKDEETVVYVNVIFKCSICGHERVFGREEPKKPQKLQKETKANKGGTR